MRLTVEELRDASSVAAASDEIVVLDGDSCSEKAAAPRASMLNISSRPDHCHVWLGRSGYSVARRLRLRRYYIGSMSSTGLKEPASWPRNLPDLRGCIACHAELFIDRGFSSSIARTPISRRREAGAELDFPRRTEGPAGTEFSMPNLLWDFTDSIDRDMRHSILRASAMV